MAFRDFKSIDAVLREYPLSIGRDEFWPETRLEVPDFFRDSLRWALSRQTALDSEAYKAENFINPFLQLVWRRHPRLHVWSHMSLQADARLVGEPDYLVAVEPTGVVDRLLQRPLLAVVEAKREDFVEGWGQCLAAMLACRHLNGEPPVEVYGVVSTGLAWEFGRLDGNRFTQHSALFTVSDPATVLGMLDALFAACERQLPPESAA